MPGPSAHGQRNKGHKPGRHAGKSARDKHRAKKEGGGPRASIKSAAHANKAERAQASKQQRDAKRSELLQARRRHSAPIVVGLLPLSDELDPAPLWSGLLAAAAAGGSSQPEAAAAQQEQEQQQPDASSSTTSSRLVTLAAHGRHRVRLTLLPPPADRNDPLAIVELAKAAEVLLLLLPGHESAAAVDAAGAAALAVLRAVGLPSTLAVVCSAQPQPQPQAQAQPGGVDAMDAEGEAGAAACPAAAGGKAGSAQLLKERSAAKKRAEKALAQHLPGDVRLLAGDGGADMQQLLRALADALPQLPVWRRQRPYLLVQAAAFVPGPQQQQPQLQQQAEPAQQQEQQQQQQQLGELHLTGYVRAQGLSANQLVTVPGAGDFRILRIQGPPDPAAAAHGPKQQRGSAAARANGGSGCAGGDADMLDADAAGPAAGPGSASSGGSGGAAPLLALPDPALQEACVRENQPDPLDGEQTWPTDEEMTAAAAAAASRMRKRRLPAGTSEYQAAWILDDDSEDGSDADSQQEASDDGEAGPSAMPLSEELPELDDEEPYGTGAESDALMADDEAAEQEAAQRMAEELTAKRQAEADDAEWPDEVDTPADQPARVRFAKYRGLKSFRSSPWDPREGLPAEYGRVFAFENPRRTAKRAHEAAARATDGSDPCAVPPGCWVTVVLADVPAAAAAALLERTAAACGPAAAGAGAAAAGSALGAAGSQPHAHAQQQQQQRLGAPVPVVVFGLLQHEAKLSVLNFSCRKAAAYGEALRSKERLLLVTGLRAFEAQPVLSDDGQGSDKSKMDRFLQDGKTCVGSVYAPIAYAPLPLLAFKLRPGQLPQLAASGALRSVDPDRLIIKKIVLTGYPVRVHKTRAVVRLMFHTPEDIRWFKPVELWTRSGRRGRITEPLGTHGAFKARFDGPVQQRDAVCMSLYKRVFPKWPGPPGATPGQPGGELGMCSFA